MKQPVVVVDTNVVVAGLLTRNPASPPARVLDGMLAAAFPFAVSETLLAEYAAVLDRAALRRQHKLSRRDIGVLLVQLAQHAIVLVPVAAPPAPDADDQFLWDLLAARSDLILVTGDRLLLDAPWPRGRVQSPVQFIENRDRPS